jgi:hypothetical protein
MTSKKGNFDGLHNFQKWKIIPKDPEKSKNLKI